MVACLASLDTGKTGCRPLDEAHSQPNDLWSTTVLISIKRTHTLLVCLPFIREKKHAGHCILAFWLCHLLPNSKSITITLQLILHGRHGWKKNLNFTNTTRFHALPHHLGAFELNHFKGLLITMAIGWMYLNSSSMIVSRVVDGRPRFAAPFARLNPRLTHQVAQPA